MGTVTDRDGREPLSGDALAIAHTARYVWAAQLVKGRTVLDAGCGAGDGSRVLAEAGAESVVGVDIAEALIDAVAPEMPPAVHLSAGDLSDLALDDDGLEIVVCLDVIDQLVDPGRGLDELCRVLAPDGALVISWSQPESDGFSVEDRLRTRFAHVVCVPVPGAGTIAAASAQELPELGEVVSPAELSTARERDAEANARAASLAENDAHIDELERRIAETEQLQRLLLDAEQRAASVPGLELRVGQLEAALAQARDEAHSARQEAAELDQRLMRSQQVMVDLYNSPSWQVTKPLRQAKKLLK